MRKILKSAGLILILGCLIITLAGCTVVFQKGRRSDIERLRISEEELLKLKKAYAALEQSLQKEIAEKKVSLGWEERGLVITFVDSVLFDSGKAQIRPAAQNTLDKVAEVCRNIVADKRISIEGHTDNQPIKYSRWKSNWELSTARATSVLHYLEQNGISPQRLGATGYGEYHPVASNETPEGRKKNRRVEILILAEKMLKAKPATQGKYVK